jgi:hypothetical protein
MVTCSNLLVHKNVQMSEVIVSDILESHHLPILVRFLDHIKTRNLPDPVDKFTDWERFQSLVSELISPRIQINTVEEANKSTRNYIASITSAYRF